MAVYTWIGVRRLDDWAMNDIVIKKNPDGSFVHLARGEWADIDDETYDYLSERFTFSPGPNGIPDPIVAPIDASVGGIPIFVQKTDPSLNRPYVWFQLASDGTSITNIKAGGV